MLRAIRRVFPAILTRDGEGAIVARTIGAPSYQAASTGESHLDPFLLLDEFFVKPPAGFPEHPHRGFTTDGAFKHEDSNGHKGTITPYGVQWMTAGRGLRHSEMPATSGVNHGMQLWINLPAAKKMCEPNYQEYNAMPSGSSPDGLVMSRVLAGSDAFGTLSPIKDLTGCVYVHYVMKPGGSVSQAIPVDYNAFVYVIQGTVDVVGKSLEKQHLGELVMDGNEGVTVKNIGDGDASFIVVGGKAINEPIARYDLVLKMLCQMGPIRYEHTGRAESS